MAGDIVDDLIFPRPKPEEYREFFDAICDLGLGAPRYRGTIAKATMRQCRSLYGKVCRLFPLGADASPPANPGVAVEIVASDSLSGGPYPCIASECRAANAAAGARFAALYADHIVIRDPLGVHGEDDREGLLAALDVIYTWRPLFENGLASHVARICTHCAAGHLEEAGEGADLSRISATVARHLTKAKLEIHRGGRREVYISVRAGEEKLAHGSATVEYSGADAAPFLKLLARKETAPISLTKARSLGVISRVAEPIVHEFVMQQLHRSISSPHAHYASNIPLDLDVANALAPSAVRWPKGLIDALAHTVPIVAHASVRDLVRFRINETAAFQRYRGRIRSVAAEARNQDALIDAADALRSDYAALEQSLRSTRAGLFRKARNELVLFGSIGIGVAATLGLAALLPLLGAAAVRTVADTVAPVDSHGVRNHPLYFLWHLQNQLGRP